VNRRPLEVEAERWLEVLSLFPFELRRNHRLVHVKDDRFLLRLLAELEGFIEQLLLIIVVILALVVFTKLVAELEQVDEVNID